MAVPSSPTVSNIVQDALRHVLTATPTSGQETELTSNGFQTVKTEIWYACKTDTLLSTSAAIALAQGNGQITLPSDFDHVLHADIYTCPDSLYFTATAGAAGTITAPATFSGDASSFRGLYAFTVGGTGSSQYRQVTNYSDSTKVLTITPNWTVTPDNTTIAFIGSQKTRLQEWDPDAWSIIGVSNTGQRPVRYRILGTTPLNSGFPSMEIHPVPDLPQYAMLLQYGPNLTRLDESGTLFVKHLRERRALWIQGLITQASRRYDEARYPVEFQRYQALLHQQQGHNTVYRQAAYTR